MHEQTSFTLAFYNNISQSGGPPLARFATLRLRDGKPLVEGKNVTGFTNSEEEAVGLTKVVPFLVEDELKAKGGHFSKTGDWGVHVVSDGLLITGQNPASSGPAAKVLLDRFAKAR